MIAPVDAGAIWRTAARLHLMRRHAREWFARHAPTPRDLAEHVTDDSIEARHTDQGATAIASPEGGSE